MMRSKSEQTLVRVGAATREQAVRDFKAAVVRACWELSDDEVLEAGWNLPDEDIEVFDYELPGGRCLYSAVGMAGDVVFSAPYDIGYYAAGSSFRTRKRTLDLELENFGGYLSQRRNSGRWNGAAVKVVVVRTAPSE